MSSRSKVEKKFPLLAFIRGSKKGTFLKIQVVRGRSRLYLCWIFLLFISHGVSRYSVYMLKGTFFRVQVDTTG